MRILAVITGAYGARHVANLRAQAPADWEVKEWKAPTALPIVIDDPEDFIPANLPGADLILAVQEHKGVAELVPDVARITGAKAVIAGVDNEAWLPRGLARQLRGWLAEMGVTCVTPKPLCSLTETRYGTGRGKFTEFEDPWIAAFAQHFGRPDLFVTVDPETRKIVAVEVRRDAVCGCAHHTAAGLIGISAEDAGEKAGLLHAHYPCLAGMDMDVDYTDTVLHVSGNITKDQVDAQVKPFLNVKYFAPAKHSDGNESDAEPPSR